MILPYYRIVMDMSLIRR